MDEMPLSIKKLFYIYSERNKLEKQRNILRNKVYSRRKKIEKLSHYLVLLDSVKKDAFYLSIKQNLAKIEKEKAYYDRKCKRVARTKYALYKKNIKFISKTIKCFKLRIRYRLGSGLVSGFYSYEFTVLPQRTWFGCDEMNDVAIAFESERAFDRMINGKEKANKKKEKNSKQCFAQKRIDAN
jgi:hypothetical protein